jgi:UDP-glucose 4-epimerase
MNILITGGAGFIGAHTCVELLEQGYSIVVIDNLSNSKIEQLERIKQITGKSFDFFKVDVTDRLEIEELFKSYDFGGVIHFAGLKAVAESVIRPQLYYYNNIVGTLVITGACQKYNVNKFIFSSSATVYGEQLAPFNENTDLIPPTTPYGQTKAMGEKILTDIAGSSSNFAVSILRYFNPIGAHKSGLIGESPSGIPNNIMPFITQVAKGKLNNLKIFGGSYPTIDGTGVRDYIHVIDIAKGHVAALNNLTKGINIYNLGTGRGTSVLELVKAFEEVTNKEILYEIVDKRPGDVAISFAEVNKAEKELGWTAKEDVYEMCRDAWRYEMNQ